MKTLPMAWIFLTFLVLPIFAQDNWQRFSWGTPDREGFTVLLPPVPDQIVKENGEEGISFYDFNDFVTYTVTFRDGLSKEEFDNQIKEFMNILGGGAGTSPSKEEVERELSKNRQTTEISVCGFSGIEFSNSASVNQFFLVNNRSYHLWVSGGNKSNPNIVRFLKSFTLINPWQSWKGQRMNENIEGFGISSEEKSFEKNVCRDIGKVKKDSKKLPANAALRFISKPSATYPEESKKNGIQGTVSLKITFLKDGTIGNILVIKGINKELNESAIKAAKMIKFEPARKNGKPVTITKLLDYAFTLY